MERTWDGLPVAPEPPFGASVIISRPAEDGRTREFLILHRAYVRGPGDVERAWGPPAGARLPGEPIEACAARDLREETGLCTPFQPLPGGAADWAVYAGTIGRDQAITLSAEHNAFAWVVLEEAVRRCLPAFVGSGFVRAVSDGP